MKNRKLTLRRESITDLHTDDLGRIAGGASSPTCYSCPVECWTPLLIDTDRVPTLNGCFTHHTLVDCITDELCRG